MRSTVFFAFKIAVTGHGIDGDYPYMKHKHTHTPLIVKQNLCIFTVYVIYLVNFETYGEFGG